MLSSSLDPPEFSHNTQYESFTEDYQEPFHEYPRGRNRFVSPSGEPICYRCHQPGHVRSGCRVRMDHSRQHLNGKWPMSMGGA